VKNRLYISDSVSVAAPTNGPLVLQHQTKCFAGFIWWKEICTDGGMCLVDRSTRIYLSGSHGEGYLDTWLKETRGIFGCGNPLVVLNP
jgi:hypothetical protein